MTPHHAHHLERVSGIIGHVEVHVPEVRVLVDGVGGARRTHQVLLTIAAQRASVHGGAGHRPAGPAGYGLAEG